MTKLDLSKLYKSYYTAAKNPEIVTVEAAQFICIQGKGDPSNSAFAKDIEALYTVAYTIKFMMKDLNQDFIVPKLEGLWWFDVSNYNDITMYNAPAKIPRSEWEYELMLRMPEYVDIAQLQIAQTNAFNKKGISRIHDVLFKEMEEGKCVQMLHIGSFDTEIHTLSKMDELMQAHQFIQNGKHHEIYISDFRKTPAEKLKTILREPVK